jgi:hypothetical protein
MIRFFSVLAIVFSLLSCSSRSASDQPADTLALDSIPQPEPVPVKIIYKDTLLDNTARFFSGLPQLDSNNISALQADKYWTDFKGSMDQNWEKMQSQRLKPMEEWQSKVLGSYIDDSLKLFYPFSGPDFLHAETFYPHATQYIMAALEPVVPIPALEKISAEDRDMVLDTLGKSLRDLFGKSYFITNHMMKDFRSINGVLPIFYFFIERTGNEMISQDFIGISQGGEEVVIPYSAYKTYNTHGVKIVFRNRETQVMKTLYYFSTDISNKGLKKRPELVAFIGNSQPYNTFVKSASYLMHHPEFTQIRDIVVNQSSSVFQDDTGVPFKNFNKTKSWDSHFYGEYVKPVKDFSWLEKQPDLDSAFAASKEPLPFSLGYHWYTRQQHYMLFLRKKNQ